ncbi:hypothetical protein CFIMG_006404RA [Ceratocystis fimbriata CBS 114723]|uniref:Chromosome transmission fidelity protein 8 n=1 Tax=Ceratocystis fimbriata CBS 114723 TaxID=1035309 RepID=A0A2C5WVJ6_9PEZI|nr:hypothetical protein CFIMG_006404RA [Ceratocystis fimbriata CBS 114723]
MDSKSIKIYPPEKSRSSCSNPLPTTIQTPSGLAIIELQGTITHTDELSAKLHDEQDVTDTLDIGHITFPNYNPSIHEEGSMAWMKTVYMFVGGHQRLQGEVKKLPQPVAIVRKRRFSNDSPQTEEVLDIVEIIKYKIVFPHRPEPVSS